MSEPALQHEDRAAASIAMPEPLFMPPQAALPQRLPARLTPLPMQARGVSLRTRAARMLTAGLEAERGHGQLFLWLPVAAGVGAAASFALPFDPSVAALAAAFALMTAITLHAGLRSAVHLPLALLLAAACGGALAAALQARGAPTLLDSDVTTAITGRVEMRDIDADGRVRYLIALEATEAPEIRRPPERVRLVARTGHEPLPIGARLKARARLSALSGPALPRGYDFAFSALQNGIGAYGFLFEAPVELPATAASAGWVLRSVEYARALRDRIAGRIRSVLPGDAGAIAATLAVSDRRGISPEVVDHLRATGLAHILAISGLHMALAAGTLYVGLRRLMALFPSVVESWPVKKIAASGALVAATVYLVLSGASVPTQRAWIMLVIMLVAVLLDRPALTMRNVAIAALVIIVISPSAVAGPGFQMSFAATAALIAAYGGWAGRAERSERSGGAKGFGLLRGAIGFIAGLLVTSLVAGIATGLFSTHHFHRIAAWGTLANLLAMPLMTLVIMPAGLVALLLMPFGLDAWPLKLMGLGLEGVIAAAAWVDSLGGDVVVGQVPLPATATAAAGFLVLVLMRGRLRFAGVLLAALGAMLTLSPFRQAPPDIVIGEDGRLIALLGEGTLASNAERPSAFVFEQWQRALRAPTHEPPVMVRLPRQIDSGDSPVAAAGAASDPPPAGRASIKRAPVNTAPVNGELARSALVEDAAALRAQRIEAQRTLRDLLGHARGAAGRFACRDRGNCVAVLRDTVIAAVDDGAAIGPACDMANLVVVGFPARIDSCRSGAVLVTARTLRRSGALAIRLLPGEARDPADGITSPTMAAAATGRRGKASFAITASLAGVVRPWTIQRYYDWRSGVYETGGATPQDARPNEIGPLEGGPGVLE
ncbi:ComEC/Rec2-related protein [Hoeflea marina]|uniref:ComEC/Rec2-related protein n=1 Tax=Hoeflea marina TaxID=274592 RepID=A0A317PQB7_9HYPH|nr:ComEC/Rec2 family competence protein [Hoeflea marina]PWW03688.1 ComEC/Rec2-related protein [Hoeflea marina]